MDAELWRRARALFDELVELAEPDASARLDALIGVDDDLRREVLALLAADRDVMLHTAVGAQAPQMLAELAEADDASRQTVLAGQRIGAFRLVRELGRGGMGTVWLAERDDGQFVQQVAIKLIRGGWEASEVQARFRAERQILAGLQHPHIAHLVDGGVTAEGNPWLALEYVDGVDLRLWCDERRLALAPRLTLFLSVCEAVSHAHQRLVVHRDLKPSNILVSAAGEVKLLDFGIAKLVDADSSAISATRVFTPEYAAPEQVRGETITTSVDVYALGLLLFELLTGHKPYHVEHSTPAAYERAILDQEPTRPSLVVTRSGDEVAEAIASRRCLLPRGLRRELRGDLDAIVLKALRKDPAQRYASVADLAADVTRHLEQRPVEARRGGWRYGVGRFLHRHAIAASLAGVAVLALVIGLGAALWQAHQARTQRDAARQSLAFMKNLFQSADPGLKQRAELSVRDLLDEGARSIQYAFADQPVARAELLLAMADAYLGLDLADPAQPLVEEAEHVSAGIVTPLLQAEILRMRCRMLSARNRQDECLPLIAQIEATLQAQNPEHRETLAQSIDMRSLSLSRSNRHEDIVADSQRVLAMLGDDPAYRRLRAEISGTLSFSLVKLKREREAEAVMRKVIAELRGATDVKPRVMADALDNLSSALRADGRNDEALALQSESVAMMENLYGRDSPVITVKLGNLGVALYSAGRVAEARPMLERAIALNRAGGEPRARSLNSGLGNLGAVNFQLGENAAARANLDEAIALSERLKLPLDTGRALRWRGILSFAQGHYTDARNDVQRSLDTLAALYAPDHTILLRGRAMLLATDFAEHGSSARNPGNCAEAARVDAAFAASSEAKTPDARFAHLLNALCKPGDVTRTASDAFAAIDADLPIEDYRRRLVQRIVAAWSPAP